MFDDNYGRFLLIFIGDKLGDSNTHHKLNFLRRIDQSVFWLSYTMHNKFSNCFCMGEPIHIRSQVSFAVMKIHAPDI